MNKCNICIKELETIKCRECTFLCCAKCIDIWFSTPTCNLTCPQCKQIRTYDVDYSKYAEQEYVEEEYIEQEYIEQVIISNIIALIPSVINNMLRDGQVFAPDQFEENYESWPETIKNQWTYTAETMTIDNVEEIVSYTIHKKESVNAD